jgi:hypothetical protein
MLNLVIGGVVALFFLGLPVAIIALFIVSSLEKWRANVPEGNGAMDVAPTPDPLADYRRDKRRRIVYGGHSVIAARLSDREKSMRLQSTQV